MATALDAIVQKATAEPADLPRLTASQVFVHYQRIGTALGNSVDKYQAIPTATPQATTDLLKEIVKQCEIAIATANRLIQSNQ